jgi:hypothetical protein
MWNQFCFTFFIVRAIESDNPTDLKWPQLSSRSNPSGVLVFRVYGFLVDVQNVERQNVKKNTGVDDSG